MPKQLWEVWDARNENRTGPFSEVDAKSMEKDLNIMVLRNTCPVLVEMNPTLTGPFYARPWRTRADRFKR